MAKTRPVRGATLNEASTRFNLPQREADGDWLDAREWVDGDLLSSVRPERSRGTVRGAEGASTSLGTNGSAVLGTNRSGVLGTSERGALPPPLPPVRTTVTVEHPKTIISRNTSPDVPFDRSINPYRGCEHGCIYCFARPSHAYHDLSPGLDFETKLFAKPSAAELLTAELRKPGYVCTPMAMGTNTDPYQPIESDWRVTRSVIEVLAACDHPLFITTKSDRVTRDLDLIAPMAAKGLAAVAISVTSLEPRIAMTVEPRAPAPARRLAAVRKLADAGVPVFVNMAPVIPHITDHEIEAVEARAAEAGARGVSFIPVRLPWEVAPLFRAWLDEHFPERAGKVMATIRSLRGGRDNDPNFGTRMRGQGPWAELLRTRFTLARKRSGIERNSEKMRLRCDLFRAPRGAQGELF